MSARQWAVRAGFLDQPAQIVGEGGQVDERARQQQLAPLRGHDPDFPVQGTEERGFVVRVHQQRVALVDSDTRLAARRLRGKGAEQGGPGDFRGNRMNVDTVYQPRNHRGASCGRMTFQSRRVEAGAAQRNRESCRSRMLDRGTRYLPIAPGFARPQLPPQWPGRTKPRRAAPRRSGQPASPACSIPRRPCGRVRRRIARRAAEGRLPAVGAIRSRGPAP